MATGSVARLHENVGSGVSRCVCHLRRRESDGERGEQHPPTSASALLHLQTPCFDSPPPAWDVREGSIIEAGQTRNPLLSSGCPHCQSPTDRYSPQVPGQDGRHVKLCGCLLATAFWQSISHLIELLSITKGFLLSQCTPIRPSEEAVHLILLVMRCLAMQMFRVNWTKSDLYNPICTLAGASLWAEF